MDYSIIIERLRQRGYHAYVVGGATRDMLMGVDPADVDIVTNATPEEIEAVFVGYPVKSVGKAFGVVLVGGHEVATFRRDRYRGLDDKACEVTFTDNIEEDLGRRDLTINAMAFCDLSGDLIDPFHGRDDLKDRTIRFVGNPKERIHEDPNRIVRACRFLAKLDGKFDPETFEALRACADYVRDYVAPDRLKAEIMKAMKIQRASKFFYALHDIGALKHIFPAMERCYNHAHGPHHLEDVFDHLMICGDSISTKYPFLKLAGYLHDVGKPAAYTFSRDKGHYVFFGHAKAGNRIVMEEMGQLRFSNKEIDYVSTLVNLHMRLFLEMTPRAVRRVLKALSDRSLSYRDLLRLWFADSKANLAKRPPAISDLKTLLHAFEVEKEQGSFSLRDLAVKGKDVMEVLGIPSGPKVGQVLMSLLDRVLDQGQKLNRRETLLAMVSTGFQDL